MLASLERRLRGTGDPDDRVRADVIAGMLEGRGQDVPFFDSGDEHLEIDLQNAEWERQVSRYIELGFHKELGLSEQAYRDSLPKFGSQPEAYKGRFDIPLIVETRIDPRRQLKLAGFYSITETGFSTRKVEEDSGMGDPYTTWVQDGTKYLGKPVDYVRDLYDYDERGGNLFDGAAFAIAHPEVLKKHAVSLPETTVGYDKALCLWAWNGELFKLDYDWIENADQDSGPLSCGK